jgi:hypothetical protein
VADVHGQHKADHDEDRHHNYHEGSSIPIFLLHTAATMFHDISSYGVGMENTTLMWQRIANELQRAYHRHALLSTKVYTGRILLDQ